MEVEFASKWKNSIGQALWYGLQTNREPGIVLILRDRNDYRYLQMLQSALDFAGIGQQIKVWAYPDDFPGVTVATTQRIAPSPTRADPPSAPTGYWLNTNSNRRHQRSCTHFGTTAKGRYCTATEGIAAGCCH